MNGFKIIFILSMLQGLAFAADTTMVSKTPEDKINLRIRQQIIQIHRDFSAGKVTKDQANSLKAQVKAIRQQEVADLKQNGNKILTDAQATDLNGQLNTLSKSIPIK